MAGCVNGRGFVLAQIAPHPEMPYAANVMIGVHHMSMSGVAVTWPPTMIVDAARFPHHAAHFADLADVDDDRRDAHDLVFVRGQLAAKPSRVGKSRDRAGREMLAWISMMPQERWNIRRRKRLERESPE